jgi:uncharacterized repeat protein (TIGR01451 family)
MPPPAQTVATFTDPAGAELTGGAPTPGEYSASIIWGDGTPASAGIITFGGGTFTVQGSHTYAEEGSYNISTTLAHGSAPNTVVNSTASVSDQSVVLNTTPLTFTMAEGATALQPVAAFTDPAGAESLNEYSATIDWGDSTSPTPGIISYSNGTFSIYGSHTYAEESGAEHPGSNPYQISVTVSHGTAATTSGVTATATVSDPAVLATGGRVLTATAGTPMTQQVVATFTDPGGPEAVGDYSADVDFGDGNGFHNGAGVVSFDGASQSFLVKAGGVTYATAGDNTLQVRVHHENAPAVTVSDTVATTGVFDLAVSVTTPTRIARPGQALGYTVSFSNAGPADATHVLLTETLPAHTKIALASLAAGWTESGDHVHFTLSLGTVHAGGTGAVGFTVVVDKHPTLPPHVHQTLNTVQITSNGLGSDTNTGNNASALATLINTPPVAPPRTFVARKNQTLTVQATQGLLAFASDADGDKLQAVGITGLPPGHQAHLVRSTGSFTYTPPLNFTGTVRFRYKVFDGIEYSGWIMVTIIVV